ncbi:methyltransferase domain-containing protein [Halobaculum gomorrense]|uniref:Trans-aconitate methyltransferase n=1 Tax=Halobaculum gomorrense TaxID=43928 RepID=A0A1M5JL88_9EURY|nr:methyltransferase domain-containing protein [Halobaculum gomorrense]SHG41334.1 Trans-aconitate methyltransferase [Halobaculum gomorrense]
MSDADEWDVDRYEESHGFVHEYGADLLDLLDPVPGERVLDLGCGTGHLTARIGERGAEAVGVDADQAMLAEARASYPSVEFREADGQSFSVGEPFDAVFSNAALHWMPDQDGVADSVRGALRPGGRFVAELGGHGNVDRVREALREEAAAAGADATDPWHFPRLGEHASLLEGHGFEVRFARLFDRPTALDGAEGLREWLRTFAGSFVTGLDEDGRAAVLDRVAERLRSDLYDSRNDEWTLGYRRLRFLAVRE